MQSSIALAIGNAPLAQPARNAITSSLERFGYGKRPCSFISLAPADAMPPLDAQALFMLVEGIDPLLLICTDRTAAFTLAKAYRTGFEPDAPTRIFGRPAVVFDNLEAMLETDDGRQRAWHLLKSIPKRS